MDSEVVPNLMIEFGIDEIQANFVAEIKLRNINKEYILKQTKAISDLEAEIAQLQEILGSQKKLQGVIVKELEQVTAKYGQPRKTEIVYDAQELEPENPDDDIPDYPVTVFVSQEGYLKKITPQSLRMSGEQKFKEGDSLAYSMEATNKTEMLVFTDMAQCYKTRLSDFDDCKASLLGDFLPTKLEMEPGETVRQVILTTDYQGFVLFFFQNGKTAKVPLSSYETKTNRRRLTGAYSDKSPLVCAVALTEDREMVLYSSDSRACVISTAQLSPKTTRNTIGVAVMSLKKKAVLDRVRFLEESGIVNTARYRTKNIPSAGAILKEDDMEEKQISFDM